MKYDYKAYENVLNALRGFNFEEFSSGDSCAENLIEYFDDSVIKIEDWAWGASKLVIIPKKGDYVIKIPFAGCEVELFPLGEDGSEMYDKGEWVFEEFQYAPCGDGRGWDYCLTEVERYALAREFGFEKYFLETFCIGFVNGHPIYVQERADEIGGCSSSHNSKTSCQEVRDKTFELGIHSRISWEWIAVAIDYMEDIDQELTDFFQFLEENNMNTDLHDGNIGYKNGFPVLVDYAGFYD